MKTEKNTFSVLFILKRNKEKKNGKAPIHGRITVNGETTQFNTKLEILPDLWGSGVAWKIRSKLTPIYQFKMIPFANGN